MSARAARQTPAPSDRELPREALELLAAALVHELRNRLNPINIHVALLGTRLRALEERKGDPGTTAASAHRSLDVLRAEVDKLDGLLDEYVRYAGPRAGSVAPIDVRAEIAGAVERAGERAKAHGVRLSIEAPVAPRWNLDAGAIRLALDALLDNAIEASPRAAEVTLRALERTDEVDHPVGVIEIEDHGEGLAPDRLRRAYEIGYTTRPGHAGLGLALAKHAVRSMPRAQLTLRSEGPGRGVTARIELPLDDEDDQLADE